MNVIRQDVDALNAVLKVEIAPADYQVKVKNTLEKYRKTAKIPGFRPGHVPFGMVQKQYGKAVLAEELNKLVNDALYKYIQDNNIEILGNPIPKEGSDVVGNFEKPDTFEFEYEIGLTPSFDIPLSGKSKYDYVKVKVDNKLLDQQVDDLRRRYGKLISVENVGDGDMILAQFVELKEDGSVKEGGIMHSSTISMEFVEDKKVKKELMGKTKSDQIEVNPESVSKGGKDTAAMLGIKEDELASISDKFRMTLRERISNDLRKMFENDSDRILTRDIYNDLVEKTKVDLPNTFLKRWIKMSNEKPITDDQIDTEYDGYAKGLKWQLIQGNIFKTNEIKLDNQEVIDFTKGLLVSNYAQYGIPAPEDKELTASAVQVLGNKEEAGRIYDMLAEQKLTN